MRLPLHPYPTLLPLPLPAAPNAPPLLFIKEEPFLVELQGSLEIEGRPGVEGGREEMRGVQVGMVNFEEEVSALWCCCWLRKGVRRGGEGYARAARSQQVMRRRMPSGSLASLLGAVGVPMVLLEGVLRRTAAEGRLARSLSLSSPS